MNELLSLSRLSRRLGVTQDWLRSQADAGEVPCLKAGNRYLFNPVAVEPVAGYQSKRRRGKGAVMSNSTPTNPPLLLTPAEASRTLAISPRKLWANDLKPVN